jgi:UDP-N-acetylglucosamine--N-acetylmuramyl-(pentapeptide) pyrophosphoryl-undecaprenol N-acetylglucosamine transferase
MRIVLAAGGTAGHVYPGLAVARVLRDRGYEVWFLGTERGQERRLVPEAGFELFTVNALPVLRKVSVATVRAGWAAASAVRRCRPVVRGAAAVVGMGGYASFPAVAAARRDGVPVLLHEQNAVPGLANRILSRTARALALSFEGAAARFPRSVRKVVTGNPVREEIVRVRDDREALAKEGRREFGLDEDRRTVLIFGGSQGALHVNQAAAGACGFLGDRADLQVLLITGPAHVEMVERVLSGRDTPLLVRAMAFVERMELAYACADLVVSRSGATTVAELSACGLPGLLIPYPHATAHHQEANAMAFHRAGAAVVLGDDDLSASILHTRILALIDDPQRLDEMARRSLQLGRPDANEAVAELVMEVAG